VRTPRGGKNGAALAKLRVSTAERDFVVAKAAELGVSVAQLRRDRLLFDMPGYKSDGGK
jgi:hypothetical protein